jgi:hypothetical protein
MTGRIPLLTGILVVQLVLIGLVAIGSTTDESAEPFLALDPQAVTGLVIRDSDGAEVVLSRSESGWRLAQGLPADSSKVDDVISSLAGGSVTWPVATSASSRDRFEVTEDNYQRRVTFQTNGETAGEVFLGTSPGFRRVHARAADSDAVYSIDFAVHQVPVNEDDWLDKKLLQAEEISEVTLSDGWRLARADDGESWLVDGVPADPEAARRVIDRLQGLSVLGLFDGDEASLGEPRTIDVVDAKGSHRLTLRHDEAEDQYVLTSDRFEGNDFSVAAYVAEQILIDKESLLPKPEADADVDADGAPEETIKEG